MGFLHYFRSCELINRYNYQKSDYRNYLDGDVISSISSSLEWSGNADLPVACRAVVVGSQPSMADVRIKPDGTKLLVNDTANGGPRAYQQGTVPDQPIEDVRIAIQKNTNGQVVLEWAAGTLEAADIVTGTYQTVTGATSPYAITPGEAQKFYRVLVR